MKLSWTVDHLVPGIGSPESCYYHLVIITTVNPDSIIIIEAI